MYFRKNEFDCYDRNREVFETKEKSEFFLRGLLTHNAQLGGVSAEPLGGGRYRISVNDPLSDVTRSGGNDHEFTAKNLGEALRAFSQFCEVNGLTDTVAYQGVQKKIALYEKIIKLDDTHHFLKAELRGNEQDLNSFIDRVLNTGFLTNEGAKKNENEFFLGLKLIFTF